jgi:hypothetical protein
MAECLASPAFSQMSNYGMPVNETILHQVINQYQQAYDDLINQLKTTFLNLFYTYIPLRN